MTHTHVVLETLDAVQADVPNAETAVIEVGSSIVDGRSAILVTNNGAGFDASSYFTIA